MKHDNLDDRLKKFALAILRFCSELPRTRIAQVISGQLIRSGTSPGANYREARRARSVAEFISKIGNVIQELDETMYWLELIEGANITIQMTTKSLYTEASELIAIFTTISKKCKRK